MDRRKRRRQPWRLMPKMTRRAARCAILATCPRQSETSKYRRYWLVQRKCSVALLCDMFPTCFRHCLVVKIHTTIHTRETPISMLIGILVLLLVVSTWRRMPLSLFPSLSPSPFLSPSLSPFLPFSLSLSPSIFLSVSLPLSLFTQHHHLFTSSFRAGLSASFEGCAQEDRKRGGGKGRQQLLILLIYVNRP